MRVNLMNNGRTFSTQVLLLLSALLLVSWANIVNSAPPCGTRNGGPCVTAVIDASSTAAIGESILFSGASSTGTNLSYAWDPVGDATGVVIDSVNSESTQISFANEGVFTIQLQVTDGDGLSDTAERSISVSNVAPPPPPQPPTGGSCTPQEGNEAYVGYQQCPIDAAGPIGNIVSLGNGLFQPSNGNWTEVFLEEFNEPVQPDRMNVVDYTKWSTRFPYGDWKNNSAEGDEGWFVNTTGLEPGLGWDGNHWPDMDRFINFLEINSKDVFSRSNDGVLTIQAHTNPWKNKINGREDYLTGVISSHTDPARTDPHGFEFKYGYVEARVRLPRDGNGFRAAFWLYSDNAYNNQLLGRRGTAPPIYEIDIMEYLPNSRSAEDGSCFIPQSDVFAITNNVNILTYDTIFQTYHFPTDADGRNRSPNNWTFNGSSAYTDARCALNFSNMDYGSNDWVTYGVLWEPDFIEWYVNDVLIHRVAAEDSSLPLCMENDSTQPIECQAPVHDGRMYIMASLHMGFSFFEGSIDTNVFVSDGGPEFEIDHIRVLQNIDSADHEHCGVTGSACDPRQ